MNLKPTFSSQFVSKIAGLANIPVTENEKKELVTGFNSVLAVIDKLFAVPVDNVPPVSQVTGLKNVLREDKVDEKRMFTNEEALKNARRTYNGYFVVDGILQDQI
jgi:aspartyl/glutamyl-tRNA(Asn/Gln) amidotransferase C subunit